VGKYERAEYRWIRVKQRKEKRGAQSVERKTFSLMLQDVKKARINHRFSAREINMTDE